MTANPSFIRGGSAAFALAWAEVIEADAIFTGANAVVSELWIWEMP